MDETGGETNGLTRLRLDLSYDGSGFHGWAQQPGLRTVQGEVEHALGIVLRTPTSVTVAGRTDTGVHARGQVAHIDVSPRTLADFAPAPRTDPLDALRHRINRILAATSTGEKGSSDVVIHRISMAPEGFDARFSAVCRTYTYRVADTSCIHDPLRRHDTLWTDDALDVAAMNDAARKLLGLHDFLSFCKPREGATTIRTLLALDVSRQSDAIVITAKADAFCHSMVRTLVGALLKVGTGARTPQWVQDRLRAANRNGDTYVAPGFPLVLQNVEYPPDSELAARALTTKNRRDNDCHCGPGASGLEG
ncbi:MAG: tRNA pseudouridine(38-40) synthase TruA [Actinomycetaceae bacterium]|nr:tRNA pseudouridine(38-40) synthase TruA [Actinomycetaceae bacterium]MDY6082863.1 tRNA pseudouridine(38-40) synthase TruA [Actinomycetaceae bacterium]